MVADSQPADGALRERRFKMFLYEGELALRRQWLADSVMLVAYPAFGRSSDFGHNPVRFFA